MYPLEIWIVGLQIEDWNYLINKGTCICMEQNNFKYNIQTMILRNDRFYLFRAITGAC